MNLYFALLLLFAPFINSVEAGCLDWIEVYYNNYDALVEAADWKEIIYQGTHALEEARYANKKQDEATICAQLTRSCIYLGNYEQALHFATQRNVVIKGGM